MKKISWVLIFALIFFIIIVFNQNFDDQNKLSEAYKLNRASYEHWSKETEKVYQPEKEACEKFFNGEFSVELEKRNYSSRYYSHLSYTPFCTILNGNFIQRFRMVKFKEDWKLME